MSEEPQPAFKDQILLSINDVLSLNGTVFDSRFTISRIELIELVKKKLSNKQMILKPITK